MCKKLILLVSVVLVLDMVLISGAGAADPDLIGWWKLDEGSGDTATDLSASGNDGTINNAAGGGLGVGGSVWVDDPERGMVISFDGEDSGAVVVTDLIIPAMTMENEFTWAFWAKQDPSQATDNDLILGNRYGGTEEPLQFIKFTPTKFEFYNGDSTYSGGINYDPVPGGIWVHHVVVKDGTSLTYYRNGEETFTNTIMKTIDENTFYMGGDVTLEHWRGYMSDVRLYTKALSAAEVLAVMQGVGGPWPYASKPNPADGSLYRDTWSTISWRPGAYAVSHDVYMGENFDDVNNGTGDTFQGNQSLAYFVAGFVGYPFPDGLVLGTTYYWRIDEVNDTEPNSPWKGPVWSFTVPPKSAYNPAPADKAAFIDAAAATLTWTPGSGAKLHTVYFGDNFDDVNDGVAGTQTGFTSYTPGPLELEKTYYWRVDEFDGAATHTGDVWSFKTAKAGGGVRADYYKGMDFNTFVLSRTDPRINFSWGDPGGPDATVGDDNFSCRWTGEVEAAFTETYTFYTTTTGSDGVRLWIDGQQLVDNWNALVYTENNGTIDLVAGNTYSLVMEFHENSGDATAELRWSSPRTPKQIIPQAALAPPIKASSPSPSNGVTGTKMTPILRWGAGDFAVSHEVYFGTDADAVKNATKSSPEHKGSMTLGDESYDPGKLTWATSYFWRVDEVNATNPDSPWVGNLWSFTTGDFIVVDDFEDYDAGENQIWYSWHDGLGYGAPGTDPYFAGNGTGAAVGYETTASYTEETIVHSGSKSMPLSYDNNKQGYSMYSETELKLTAPRDWTEQGVTELSLWFRGNPASVGSFVEGPVGTYSITASGADIWTVNGVEADEFHFAYKMLTGAGSMVAKVQSLDNTNVWAKAGVMIRETLDPDSAHAYMAVTPANGVSFQRRPGTNVTSTSDNSTTLAEAAPYWVKIDRTISGTFTASSSTNGTTWVALGTPQTIAMGSNVYIGLALTSHDAALTCQAVFSNVTTTGNVSGQWAHQDIGITSNAAEPLYVAVSNSTGNSAIVVNDDTAAAQTDTWTEWVIPLQAFADQGIVLTNVDRIAIGLGTRGNMTVPGGSGKMYFDDIRLYRPAPEPEPEPEP